jgi:hypothetical protein
MVAMNQTLKRLAVIIEGETVRFRQTPYGKWIVGCSCMTAFCRHRFKAIPEWKRFKEEG